MHQSYRQNYRNKVQKCRGTLQDKFRELTFEKDNMCNVLKELYKEMIDFSEDILEIEDNILQEIKNELIQEELEWLLEEYQKTHMDDNIDWSKIEQDNVIVCPICQRDNFMSVNSCLKCPSCNVQIKTSMQTSEVKEHIFKCLDKHNSVCISDPQFTVIKDTSDCHIYLICETCNEMTYIL
ncbi:uncharacterized protein LOC101743725 isoform X2 [Bombyx mori]|uniref:RPA-interacting protein C-terminal domain-containing protein n=1 Tax=Bombyx mori TaxID=7091 RepID=A0A8R2G7H0_BOMMO|nr:uncharacterized protein LOC101743725 isoform X2 [Bombyx mori]